MSKIESSNPQLYVDQTVTRQTPRAEQRSSFGSVLRTGAAIALRGVELGGGIVGGPIVGAALRGVAGGLMVGGGGASSGGLVGGGGGGAGGVLVGVANGVAGDPLATGATGATNEQNTMNQVQQMQEQSQEFNLQYLNLQEEVQQENRRFTTVSNVLKAKHETAKSAIGNIRS